MKKFSLLLILWFPRIVSILLALFTLLFTFDAFDGNGSTWKQILAWLIHLIPTIIISLIAWFSWNRPWVGGIAFTALGVAYFFTYGARSNNHIIDLILLGIGIIFLASWLVSGKTEKANG